MALFRNKSILECTSGNFGLLAAIILPVTILAIGIAVDCAMAFMVKSDMQNAADAAVLSPLNAQSKEIVDALTNDQFGPIPASEKHASEVFLANISESNESMLIDHKATVRREASLITSEIVFRAAVPTSFLSIVNIKTIEISSLARAEFAPEAFFDFHILLDNSPSMGIGTTQADIRKLESARGIKCAFACHNLHSNAENTYELARAAGISVRIDVVALALSRMIERAAKKNYETQYRMALYSFGERASAAQLTTIAEMTEKLNKVSDAAANVKLMSVDYFGENNHWLSDFDTILTEMAAKIKTQQNVGYRQRVALIISDGMNDSAKSAAQCKYRRFDGKTCWQPADPAYCKNLKDGGVKVAILYTTFFPIPNDGNYRNYIAPWQPQISETLRDCASPGLFFEISASAGIDDAMNALFSQITNTQYLTR